MPGVCVLHAPPHAPACFVGSLCASLCHAPPQLPPCSHHICIHSLRTHTLTKVLQPLRPPVHIEQKWVHTYSTDQRIVQERLHGAGRGQSEGDLLRAAAAARSPPLLLLAPSGDCSKVECGTNARPSLQLPAGRPLRRWQCPGPLPQGLPSLCHRCRCTGLAWPHHGTAAAAGQGGHQSRGCCLCRRCCTAAAAAVP